jgi:hypothetical protein
MPPADPRAESVTPADVDAWLAELGIEPLERVEREHVTSWDLRLDGRRRFDIRVTLILDPSIALVSYVHFAPPISDLFRRSYRKLLRWNDDILYAKFAVGEDERPILMSEIPVGWVSSDELGRTLARQLAICDRYLDESAGWIWIGGRRPDTGDRVSRQVGLFARYADQMGDLAEP